MSATRSSRDARTAEILQAARALFSEKGYEQCSMAEIDQRNASFMGRHVGQNFFTHCWPVKSMIYIDLITGSTIRA